MAFQIEKIDYGILGEDEAHKVFIENFFKNLKSELSFELNFKFNSRILLRSINNLLKVAGFQVPGSMFKTNLKPENLKPLTISINP